MKKLQFIVQVFVVWCVAVSLFSGAYFYFKSKPNSHQADVSDQAAVKGSGVLYFDSLPDITPDLTGSEIAWSIDNTSLWGWDRVGGIWGQIGGASTWLKPELEAGNSVNISASDSPDFSIENLGGFNIIDDSGNLFISMVPGSRLIEFYDDNDSGTQITMEQGSVYIGSEGGSLSLSNSVSEPLRGFRLLSNYRGLIGTNINSSGKLGFDSTGVKMATGETNSLTDLYYFPVEEPEANQIIYWPTPTTPAFTDLPSGGNTIYNANDALTSNRTVTGAGNSLSFSGMSSISTLTPFVNILNNVSTTSPAINLYDNTDTKYIGLYAQDLIESTFYAFPDTVGTTGQVLHVEKLGAGSGKLYWADDLTAGAGISSAKIENIESWDENIKHNYPAILFTLIINFILSFLTKKYF